MGWDVVALVALGAFIGGRAFWIGSRVGFADAMTAVREVGALYGAGVEVEDMPVEAQRAAAAITDAMNLAGGEPEDAASSPAGAAASSTVQHRRAEEPAPSAWGPFRR